MATMRPWVTKVERPQRVTVPAPVFWQALSHYFGLDDHQQARVWQAILKSKWSAVREWRQAVALLEARSPTIDGVMDFLKSHTPPERLLAVLEAVVLEGLLPRHEMVAVEEKVLAMVTNDGKWK
jgi:hypothetical protein